MPYFLEEIAAILQCQRLRIFKLENGEDKSYQISADDKIPNALRRFCFFLPLMQMGTLRLYVKEAIGKLGLTGVVLQPKPKLVVCIVRMLLLF